MILYLLLTAATSATPVPMPPVACIRTAIDRRGRFTNSKIVESSGIGSVDRDALQLLKSTDLSQLFPGRIERQTGYLLVRANETGAVTMGFTGKLLESCPETNSSQPVPAGT